MLRLQRVSTLIGGAISVLYPPIAVVYYFARTVYKHVSLNSALPWLILVCPLLLPAFLYFPGTKALNLLGQAILLIGYGYAFTSLPKKQLRQTFVLGMVIGLICLLGLGFITQRINMSNWYSYSYQKPWIQKFTEGVFNLERLEGKALRSSFGQRWILDSTQSQIQTEQHYIYSFEARSVSGEGGWSWYTHNPQISLERMSEGFTRVHLVEGEQAYLSRRMLLPDELAAVRFRLFIELRASQVVSTSRCEGVRLGLLYEKDYSCQMLDLDKEWKVFSLEYTSSKNGVLEIMLRDLGVEYYDIRQYKVQALVDQEWIDLGPFEPAAMVVQVRLQGLDPALTPSLNVLPGKIWEKHELEFQAIPSPKPLTVLSQIEGGLVVQVRNSELNVINSSSQPQQVPFGPRLQLWFGQPNLLGHSVVTIALLSILLSSSLQTRVLLVVLSLSIIFLTGSRAAWFVLLMASTLVLVFTETNRRRAKIILIVGGISLMLLITIQGLGRLDIQNLAGENTINRLAIWRFSLDEFLASPWQGIADKSFNEAWQERYPKSHNSPLHAHNFWLEFALQFGIPGLAGSVIFTILLLYLGWCWGQVRGVLFICSVLLINWFDYTLFHFGILIPLVCGLAFFRNIKREMRKSDC